MPELVCVLPCRTCRRRHLHRITPASIVPNGIATYLLQRRGVDGGQLVYVHVDVDDVAQRLAAATA